MFGYDWDDVKFGLSNFVSDWRTKAAATGVAVFTGIKLAAYGLEHLIENGLDNDGKLTAVAGLTALAGTAVTAAYLRGEEKKESDRLKRKADYERTVQIRKDGTLEERVSLEPQKYLYSFLLTDKTGEWDVRQEIERIRANEDMKVIIKQPIIQAIVKAYNENVGMNDHLSRLVVFEINGIDHSWTLDEDGKKSRSTASVLIHTLYADNKRIWRTEPIAGGKVEYTDGNLTDYVSGKPIEDYKLGTAALDRMMYDIQKEISTNLNNDKRKQIGPEALQVKDAAQNSGALQLA